MKKLSFIFGILVSLLFIKCVKAAINLEVSVSPDKVLFYDGKTLRDIYVFVNCSDSSNNTVWVRGNITGPYIKQLDFYRSGNGFYAKVSKEDLSVGNYYVNVYCLNNNSEYELKKERFEVLNLDFFVENLPSTIYEGESFDVDVVVSINGDRNYILLEDSFEVYLDGNKVPFSPRFNDLNKYWELSLSGTEKGVHNLTIGVSLFNSKVYLYQEIEVNPIFELNILGLNKDWIKEGDSVVVSFEILDKGNLAQISNNSISLYLNGEKVKINEFVKKMENYEVKFTAPYLRPGEYEIKIKVNYKDLTLESTEKIYYPVKVEGNLKNEKGQGIPNVIITFVSKDSNFRKSIVTDSSGEYSGEILPGEYNIVIEAKGLKAEFFDVNIDEFSDPLKFNYLPNLKVDGFINAGLYVLEAAFSYTKVSLNLHYDEGKILNESRISLFRCKSWNFVKNICYSGWEEVETQKDMVRNSVRVNLTSLSAFLVGSRRMLKAEFSLDKTKYFLEDVVKIKGLVKDELGERVGKAKVVIEGTSEETISEDNGYFEIEFIAPDEEGRHTFKLRAEKENYLPFEESFEIVLERKKEISLVIPKTVNVELDENSTVNIKVVNSGQTDFENVKIELSGIPEEFYEILDNDFYLPEGLSRDVRILFKIPKEANLTQIPVKVKANSGDVYSEKVINLVISKEKETVEGNKLSFPTAKIILPSLPVTLDILGLTLFSVVSIGGAFLLRKKRKTKSYSEDIRSLLFKIKEEVEGKNLLRREKDES